MHTYCTRDAELVTEAKKAIRGDGRLQGMLWQLTGHEVQVLNNWFDKTLFSLQIIDLVGEDIGVPDDYTDQDMVTGMWWRHLVAGGVAGAVSRTCTAPLDRLKIFLQVSTQAFT